MDSFTEKSSSLGDCLLNVGDYEDALLCRLQPRVVLLFKSLNWTYGPYSSPGSSVLGISQASILEWVAMLQVFAIILDDAGRNGGGDLWKPMITFSPGGLLTKGLNPCLLFLLHWWKGSLPLAPPGNLFFFWSHLITFWRRKWQPTPVLLPGKFHGWRNLVHYCPWGCKESNMTKQLHFLSFLS